MSEIHDKRKSNERTHRDPVCGMKVSRSGAVCELKHEGRTYYFCAEICMQRFSQTPELYIHQHRQRGYGGSSPESAVNSAPFEWRFLN